MRAASASASENNTTATKQTSRTSMNRVADAFVTEDKLFALAKPQYLTRKHAAVDQSTDVVILLYLVMMTAVHAAARKPAVMIRQSQTYGVMIPIANADVTQMPTPVLHLRHILMLQHAHAAANLEPVLQKSRSSSKIPALASASNQNRVLQKSHTSMKRPAVAHVILHTSFAKETTHSTLQHARAFARHKPVLATYQSSTSKHASASAMTR